jgi:gliding motility-associated lipoprotein GldH
MLAVMHHINRIFHSCRTILGKLVSRHLCLAGMMVALASLLVACEPVDLYNEYQPTCDQGWHRDSLLHFNVPVTPDGELYNLFLQIRHTVNYQYSDLWMEVVTHNPDSVLLSVDTVRLVLVDNRGIWRGDGAAYLYHLPWLYRQKMTFTQEGEYRFSLRHCMSDSVVAEITHVGLRISNSEWEKIN